MDEGVARIVMGKKLDDDVEKDIEDCYYQCYCEMWGVNIPEVANDSSIVSPSTPRVMIYNIVRVLFLTWLDYVGPLITDELDSEKRWSYRDPKGNIQGSFSLAQLHMWKDYFPSDLQIWSYYGNVKETILLHNALKRRTKNAG
ncbi:zinc finger CCCH domain-containing protein 19 [Tanacetum coccineum]